MSPMVLTNHPMRILFLSPSSTIRVLQTKHQLYMSSKPFEDPDSARRAGIAYTVDDGMGNKVSDTLDPVTGWAREWYI